MSLTFSRVARLVRSHAAFIRRDPGALRDFPAWCRSFLTGRTPLASARPWINFPAQAWLGLTLTSAARVFEYGSGGSTVYFSRRAATVVSVEHDRSWHVAVSDVLVRAGRANCALLLMPPEPLPANTETAYRSAAWPGWSFERYVRTIDVYPNGTFDLVFIDGRARAACIPHALPKICPGGHLMVDNTDRPQDHGAFTRLAHLPRQDFVGFLPGVLDLGQTSVWTV